MQFLGGRMCSLKVSPGLLSEEETVQHVDFSHTAKSRCFLFHLSLFPSRLLLLINLLPFALLLIYSGASVLAAKDA